MECRDLNHALECGMWASQADGIPPLYNTCLNMYLLEFMRTNLPFMFDLVFMSSIFENVIIENAGPPEQVWGLHI